MNKCNENLLTVVMYNIYTRVAPDTDLAGYLANIFAGYPVSGLISGTWLDIRLNSNILFLILQFF